MFPLISIVVPCYNASKTLDRLVKSVMAQIYTKYELLLIDDGSTDLTLACCRSYADMDDRITVIQKQNEGVSSARNLGISIAKGEWITFVDADDELKETYLIEMVERMTASNTEMVLSNVMAVSGGEKRIFTLPSYNIYRKESFRQFLIDYINHPILKVNHSKLYKKSILNKHNIRYNSRVRLSEDALFVLDYLLCINSLSLIPCASYIYYQPYNLGFKYQLSLDEAVYKCDETERVLHKLESKYNCSLASRIEQNWHKSLGYVSLEDYIETNRYSQIVNLYGSKCQHRDLLYDSICNRYLKCCYHLAYNIELDKNKRDQLCHYLANYKFKDYRLSFSFPKKMLLIAILAKLGSGKLLNYIVH